MGCHVCDISMDSRHICVLHELNARPRFTAYFAVFAALLQPVSLAPLCPKPYAIKGGHDATKVTLHVTFTRRMCMQHCMVMARVM